MRHRLSALTGQRTRFRGRFRRYGIRPKLVLPPVRTLCLEDIEDAENAEGIVLADHLWFTCGQRFADLGEITEGQVLEFSATVTEYEKRHYLGRPERQRTMSERGTDYRLSYPSRIEIVRR